jgi:hypothetical protein
VKMLETISPEKLLEATENTSYMTQYTQILQQFDEYMSERTPN